MSGELRQTHLNWNGYVGRSIHRRMRLESEPISVCWQYTDKLRRVEIPSWKVGKSLKMETTFYKAINIVMNDFCLRDRCSKVQKFRRNELLPGFFLSLSLIIELHAFRGRRSGLLVVFHHENVALTFISRNTPVTLNFCRGKRLGEKMPSRARRSQTGRRKLISKKAERSTWNWIWNFTGCSVSEKIQLVFVIRSF